MLTLVSYGCASPFFLLKFCLEGKVILFVAALVVVVVAVVDIVVAVAVVEVVVIVFVDDVVIVLVLIL